MHFMTLALAALAVSITLCLAHAAAAAGPRMRSLEPPVLLPDGTEFMTWEAARLRFRKTYHVDGSHAKADDDGPGSRSRPFRTINRAAQALRPGERVVVAAGVYRERVVPARGGTGSGAMISYEAAPGAEVAVKGSRVLETEWKRSELEGLQGIKSDGGAKVKAWRSPLPAALFGEYNPFKLPNVTPKHFGYMSWATRWRGKKPYTLPRGLVFQDGRRLAQAYTPEGLAKRAGTYWVEPGGEALHVRLFGDADPNAAVTEITTLGVVFGPDEIGLGYVRVKGLTIEHAGNQFPMPQEGALSTRRGNHWIIEGNTVRHANGVGIDFGTQYWALPQPDEEVGHHIVRANTVTDCGVCGLQGLRPTGSLVEDNVVLRNAFHPVAGYYETAGIKMHCNRNVLIRRNVVMDTIHGSGIWMDFANINSRCTRNVLVGNRNHQGGIFLEASNEPNLIDHNFIWESEGHGIYEHDSCGQTFAHNFIGKSTKAAVCLRGKVTNRKISGRAIVGGDHQVVNNIFFANRKGIETKDEQRDLSRNLSEGVTATFDRETMTVTWQVTGEAPRCEPVANLTRDFFGRPRPEGGVAPGPFARLPAETTRTRLREGE